MSDLRSDKRQAVNWPNETDEQLRQRQLTCDHIPMKAALDNSIGCIRCGVWLKAQ